MDKIDSIIQEYLRGNLKNNRSVRTSLCLDEDTLLRYMQQQLKGPELSMAENHVAKCGYCLSQIVLAHEAKNLKSSFQDRLPPGFIEKAKELLQEDQTVRALKNSRKKRITKIAFLAATTVCFVLSFFIHRYFLQFLVASLILGIRWAFDSEGGRTLTMVIDSWRKRSRDDDEEISKRLKR